MYRRLAQLEKLVENDNSSSRRPRYDIFFGLDDGKCKANPKWHFLYRKIPSGKELLCEGTPLWCAFMSTTALPVIQDEKNIVTRPPRRRVIVLHEFFELSEPPVHFSSPLAL